MTRNSSFIQVPRIVKPKMIQCTRYVPRMGKQRTCTESWWRNLLVNVHLKTKKMGG